MAVEQLVTRTFIPRIVQLMLPNHELTRFFIIFSRTKINEKFFEKVFFSYSGIVLFATPSFELRESLELEVETASFRYGC